MSKNKQGKTMLVPVTVEALMEGIQKIIERKRGNEFNLEISEGRDENYYGTTFSEQTPAWRTRIQLTIYEPIADNEKLLGKLFAVGHKLTTHDESESK